MFFGEEYGVPEIQDLIAMICEQTSEAQNQPIHTKNLFSKRNKIGDIAKANPDKEFTFEELQGFFSGFLKFSDQINDLTSQMNAIRDMLIQELKSRGLELPNQ